MFARFTSARKTAARLLAPLAFVWLAACDPSALIDAGGSGPKIDPNAPVQVALLVPGGSGSKTDDLLAVNLENAARMAMADLKGVKIDLRVYNTAGKPDQAAQVAVQAVEQGAKVILGPLYGSAANSVGIAVAPRNVNVLAFSNNPEIAGGNVFVLGATFQNTANRLVQYSKRQGIDRYMVVHADDLQGQIGRDAITNAVKANGATMAGVASYPLSQQGILDSTRQIAAAAKSTGANALFLTAGVNADLPILATALPEAGLNPADTKYIGLTRWNAAPQALALPGLQGGLFALPDRGMKAVFESRYSAAYGDRPHPLAGLSYDGIAAIGALVAAGKRDALTAKALTAPQGFQGTSGIFRLLPNGLNERGLSVATVRNNQVVIVEGAPKSFGGAGF